MFSNTNSNNNSSGIGGWDFSGIFDNNFLDWTNRDDFKNDLYYQDMITMNNGDILWFYLPNPLKLSSQSRPLVSTSIYTTNILGKHSNANETYAQVILFKKNNNEILNAIDMTHSIFKYFNDDKINTSIIAPLIIMPSNQYGSNKTAFSLYLIGAGHSNAANMNLKSKNFILLKGFEYDGNNIKFQGGPEYTQPHWLPSSNVLEPIENWKTWTKEYNNAMLIPMRNMFDENLITFATPYASPKTDFSSSNVVLPVFNVNQLYINPNDVNNTSFKANEQKSRVFNFGEQIYTNYTKLNLETQHPVEYSPRWYPWPGAVNISNNETVNNYFSQYTNQLYNRLINVSPYDNTIIYAARPNSAASSSTNAGDKLNGNNMFSNYYASFWVSNPNNKVGNFVITNNTNILSSSSGTTTIISSNLINSDNKINSIYQNGFWFDINSMKNTNVSDKMELNLYFNVSGNYKNQVIENQNSQVKSSPIGMINTWFSSGSTTDGTTWVNMNQIIASTVYNTNKVFINDDSYSNYITSRANLTKWYPRTYQSLTQGVNTINDNQLVNSTTSSVNKQVVINFGKQNYNQNTPYELFSVWKQNDTNYNNKIPTITYTIGANNNGEAKPNLNLSIQFQLDNNWSNSFISTTDIDKAKTIEIPITVPNVSWQFLNSWSINAKLDNYTSPSNDNILGNMNVNWISNSNGQGNYGDTFNSINNMGYWQNEDDVLTFKNITSSNDGISLSKVDEINKYPLRVVFAINPDPDNSLSSSSDTNVTKWLNDLKSYNNGKFIKKYPLVGSNGETNFNQILKEYADWKAQNLTYSNNVDNPSLGSLGLGQITIDAYLELNPYWDKLSINSENITIYTLPENTNTKILIDKTTNIKYIYKDDYQNSRSIYKQNSTTFSDNNKYGFGANDSDLDSSWVNTPSPSLNLKMLVDSIKVANVLVRDGNTTTNNIFTAKYVESSTDIILEPKADKVDWAKTHLPTYSLMTGTGIIFEYKTKDSSEWQSFNTTNGNLKYDENNGSYTIKNSIRNIQSIRFKLSPLSSEDNENIVTKYDNWSNQNVPSTFISDEIKLEVVQINVDYTWFNNVTLAFQDEQILNKFLNDENGQEQFIQAINKYEQDVKAKMKNLPSGVTSSFISIKYSLNENNSDYVDANDLYDQLKQKWENYDGENGGIIALYNEDKLNNTNATKIYVKFELNDKDVVGNYELIQSDQKGNNYIKKTTINFKINLKSYINVLQSIKTDVIQTNNGSITNFTPPAMTGNGFLGGKTFNQIVELLKKFGVSVQYKKIDNSYTDNKSEITSYDPTNPIIEIRFTVSNDYNVKVSTNGSETIDTISSDILLPLNVPLLIQWNDSILDNFKTDYVIGNTKNIEISQSKEQELIQKIAEFNNQNNNNSNKDLWDNLSDYLEIKYAIGESTSYYSRQEFINYLNTSTTTQYNNQINIKLFLKDKINNENGEAKFLLSSDAGKNHILYDNQNNYIKIFIVNNYTNLFNQITVSGTTNNLSFRYPEQLQKIKNNEIIGLKIAYSLKRNINYDDKVNENDGNIESEWVITQPKSVPTSAKILKIKIYTTNESLYIFEGNTIGNIDLTEIAKPIDVNSSWFNEIALTINGSYLKDIQESDITNWEDKIWNKSNAINNDSSLKQYVSIKYNIDGNGSYSAEELLSELKGMQEDYSSSTLGIVYLWDGIRGTKINATFTTSNPQLIMFTNVNDDSPNSNLTNIVQTSQIKTYIDLSNWANVLNTNKTSVQLIDGKIGTIKSFTPPSMTGDEFLGGKTFDQISEVIEKFGTTFKFNNGIANSNWNIKDNVNLYDDNNPFLYLGIEYDDNNKPNIVFNFGNNNTNVEGTTLNTGNNALVILQLQAPVSIIVNLEELNKLSFQGNTKIISNTNEIKNKINEIINGIKANNSSAITNDDLELEIRFSLNNIKLEDSNFDSNFTNDGIWYTFDKFNDILLNSKTNYTSNKILAKFYIKNNPILDGGINKYQLSDSNEQIINEEELSGSNIQFKIYINSIDQTNSDWIIENLKIIGTQENFTISNYKLWINNIPQGLTIEYNVTSDEQNLPSVNDWKNNLDDAKPINATRDFWIRFKIGDAYVFEGSINNTQYSDAIKLDASAISVSLKIQSNWLNQVILTGNLKDLIINESHAIETIKSAGQMPIENIIQIEYTYDGVNWLKKEQFEAKLQELKGAKNDINWIILREDIKARFILNQKINNTLQNKYVLEIDGINIGDSSQNEHAKQLITTTNNNNVKGYINLDKFNEFVATNFKVTGTDSNANLIVSNINSINSKLNPYSSNNLFSILYKWDQSNDYDPGNKIWTPGQEIQEITKLNGTYENRFFGIQFKVDNVNYDLYRDNKKQSSNGYEITTPQIEMQISVEIENPFTLTNSKIEIKFLNDNSQPQWYNNDGAFTIAIEKEYSNGTTQTYNSFSIFLNSLSSTSYTDEMRNALELVYYVSPYELNEEEYNNAISVNEINKYDKNSEIYNNWKSLLDLNDVSQLNYHLKVGDYIIVALRIKEASLTTESNPNGYVLKNNDHSPTKIVRVSGYKIHTDYIDVDWQTMKLRNVGMAESASYGLDGYAMLDQISLKQNSNSKNSNDYLNVSLKLNYFTEFYEKEGRVLVSGSGTRLVKRNNTNATINGYYKDSNGQEIKDSSNQPIPILYKNDQPGILANPIKSTTSTRTYNLIESTSNVYTLELSNDLETALYSFFKNQDISITFENKKGLAEGDLYDYYVDTPNASREYIITNEIKFPIENYDSIQYTFNSDTFIEYIKDPNNLASVYQNASDSNKNPINGQSKLVHMYEVTRTSVNGIEEKLTTIESIQNKITTDFNNQVILKTTYTPVNGTSQNITSNDLGSINTLSNGDRFRVEIVSSNNDLIYAQQPSPLIFTVSGLYEQDIEESLLQYLRVQQNGEFNGEGSFGIYVDDPNSDNDDNKSITSLLQGYKFMIRVWDSNKTIKQVWTSDIDSVTNLSNGDKVEWKLVAPSGSPVENAYYNTVADQLNHDANGGKYSFIQVNKTGNFNTSIIANSIGKNPTTDTYPTDSGLLIESLKEKDEQNSYTSITETEFIRLMNGMNFSYTGINGQGNMISDKNVSDVVVNTTSPTRQEFTFEYLIQQGYLKFYSNNIEFNWNQIKDNNGNWLISPGTLSNGDQISIRYQDDTMASYYQWSAPEVSGLKNKSDSMSLLTYVGIGVASLVTLGAFALIYFKSRNRKLKK